MHPIQNHPVTAFFLLTYLISWICWLPLFLTPEGTSIPLPLFIVLGGFGPAISALVITWTTGGRAALLEWAERFLRWRVGCRWYLFVAIYPFLLLVLAYLPSMLSGEALPETLTTSHLWLMFPVFFLLNLFLGGGQEEAGWRGFALPALQADYSAGVSSIIIGVVWAFWHLPLFFTPLSSQTGLPFSLYLLHVVAMSVIYSWIFNNTGGSVLMAALFHGFGNTYPGLLPLDATSGLVSPFAILVGAEWITALLLLRVYGAENLSHSGREINLVGRGRHGH